MSTVAPPRPPARRLPDDPEALFAEARHHRRRRRFRIAAVAVLLLALAGGIYIALGDGATRDGASPGGAAADAAALKTVVLVVDVSASMRSDDVKPTRLGAAVAAMGTFVDQLPDRVEVALVSFSSTATVVQTPTLDRARVRKALGSLEPQAGTALGDGLAAATALATRESGRYLPAAIVLESDGAQNRGHVLPLPPARHAKAAGVPIYGIALGTSSGIVEMGGRLSNTIPVPTDPRTVKAVARTAAGASYVAQDAAGLTAAYRQIASQLS